MIFMRKNCRNRYIICTRLNYDLEIINYIILSNEGENSFLTIINNINYLSILFLNGENIYKKNIHPPIRKNTTKEIYEEVEINLDIKNDGNYFLNFKEFDEEILIIKLNEKIINKNEKKI